MTLRRLLQGRAQSGGVLLGILIVALTAFHTGRLHRDMVQAHSRSVEALTRVAANDLNRTLQRIDALLGEVVLTLEDEGVRSPRLPSLLAASLINERLLRETAIVDASGLVVLSSSRGSSGAQVGRLFDAPRGAGLMVGRPFAGRSLAALRDRSDAAAGTAVIPLGRGMAQTDSGFVVVGLVGIDSLMNEMVLLTGGGPERLSLDRYDGAPLIAAGALPPADRPPGRIFSEFLPRFEHGAYDETGRTGAYLVQFRTTADYPVIVSIRSPYATVTAAWIEEVLIAAVPLALSLAAIAFYTRTVVRALDRSAEARRHAALQEQRLRNVMEGAAEGIVTIGQDGLIRDYNRAAERIFGVPADEAIGRPLATVLPEGEAALHQGRVQRYVETGRSGIIGVGRLISTTRRDGRRLDLYLSLSEIVEDGERLFTGLVHDVTAMRQAEERFRLLFEQSTGAHLLYDEAGLIACNRAAALLIGARTPAELAGRPLTALADIAAEDVSTLLEAQRRADAGGVQRLSLPLQTHDGRAVFIDVSLTAITIDDRRAFLAVWHDMTERHRQAEALRQARDAAEAATQAKTRFLAMMSHELRTPMTGVLGMLDLLSGSALTAEQAMHLTTLRRCAESLLTVLNDVLDFSKIEAGKLQLEHIAWSPGELCREIVELHRPRAQERTNSLDLSIAADVPATVQGDPTRVRQILVNLIGNAIKFTCGGQVRLELRVRGGGRPSGPLTLSFTVADTGIGIPPERMGVLFLPFEQADTATTRRYGGTGLGLAICRQLSDAMNGRITVESVVGRGSTFRFDLPVQLASATAPACPGEPAQSVELRPLRILMAEDNATVRDLVVEKLQRAGHAVTAVENGSLAVRAAGLTRYDVILLDMHMPELDGPAAARAIRAGEDGGRRVPVVALTADVFTDGAGLPDFDAVVTKPISWIELTDVLARLVPDAVAATAPRRPGPEPAPAGGRLAALRDEVGGAALARILKSYLASGTEDLGNCRLAIAAGDPKKLRDACHRFRGAASNLGFDGSAAAARRLETAGPAEWAALADALEGHFAADRQLAQGNLAAVLDGE